MAHPSKRKGNNFERELVNKALDQGIPAKRAYASNGEALGLSVNVACLIGGMKVQAKRRKSIASFMQPDPDCDIQVIRQDRGRSLAVMDFETLLELLK